MNVSEDKLHSLARRLGKIIQCEDEEIEEYIITQRGWVDDHIWEYDSPEKGKEITINVEGSINLIALAKTMLVIMNSFDKD